MHENHGLGIFRGIEKIEVNKTVRDYMKIEYDRGGTLYVLATQLDLIQKYAGSDAKKPKLNRLGGQEWTKTRSRVKKAVQVIAKELVELYAVRQNSEGYQNGPDTIWQKEFEEMFPYEETGRSADGHPGYQSGYGEPEDHGPADLRRRGIRQDRGGDPGGLQGGAGEQAGGLSGAHHHPGAAALTIILFSG